MRICIACSEFPPVTDYHGGIGTEYGRLAPALARLGHDVHVVTLAPREKPLVSEVDGVRVHAEDRGRLWPWFPLAWSRSVARRIRAAGPFDVVLAAEFRAEAERYAARPDAGPLVTHLLTSQAQLSAVRPDLTLLERHGPRARLQRAMERRQAQRSRGLLVPGRAILDWARELWPLDGIPVQNVPLSIDFADVRAKAAAGPLPDGFPRGGPTVTLASRLDGHKGAQQLVAAMHKVWRRHPDAQLVFVGRDARYKRRMMSDVLRELAGDRVGQVHILGFQPWERYFAAVAASDIVAIPSLWESFCLAAVEAMALGRPVIGTRGHGFDEYIRDGENGLLVGRGEVDGLADAIERLLDDAALRSRLGAAAERMAAELDPVKTAPLYEAAFARLTGSTDR